MANLTENLRNLASREQERFVTLLAHQLTVSAREFYELPQRQAGDLGSLMTMNELLHRILGYALGGCPDRSLVQFMDDLAQYAGEPRYQAILFGAVERAFRAM